MIAKFLVFILGLALGFLNRKRAARFDFSVGLATSKNKRRYTMLDLTITNEQKVKVTLNPVTAAGKPAQLDGKANWSVVSGDATLDVAEDGLSAFLISGDNSGDSAILVEADADLGEGIVNISDTINLKVEGANASSLSLASEPPVAK